MAHRMRKRLGATPAEALWPGVCASALKRRMRMRCGATPVEALWSDACGSTQGRHQAQAPWRDACESAMTRRLRRRYVASYAEARMARRLRKRSGGTPALWRCQATQAEALWRDACGRVMARRRRFALCRDACGSAIDAAPARGAMARSPVEALWRVTPAWKRCARNRLRKHSGGDAMRTRSDAKTAQALWSDDCGSALARYLRTALWRDACGNDMTRRLRRRYGASYAEALWRDTCGSAMARRLRKRSDETHADALWRDTCGSAVE